jgi:hypothetical protein
MRSSNCSSKNSLQHIENHYLINRYHGLISCVVDLCDNNDALHTVIVSLRPIETKETG